MHTDISFLSRLKEIFHNPHALLGLHATPGGEKCIYVFRPGAKELYIEVLGRIESMERIEEGGVFALVVPRQVTREDYRVYHHSGLLAEDPYAFLPTLGQQDEFLFNKGVHYQIYDALGAHPTVHQNCKGTRFAVWAPGAQQVSLVGDFNYWDGRSTPLRLMGASGIWEIFVPGLGAGEKYKFEIRTQGGGIKIKNDPCGNQCEMRPLSASVIADLNAFTWTDQKWCEERTKHKWHSKPLCIYEVHLGSWRKKGSEFINYRELAHELAQYCREMGFTHVELLPVAEHPLDESWGYQVTGFYAVTSRFGNPLDFQYFVNYLHTQGIGIILDWVPAHFPTDEFSLAQFDGTYLYEHADPRQGFHPHWNTLIFNYGRHEVTNFLIGSALFWLEKMHLDGLRVDAVASMLYLDYGRKEGEWIPNRYGGRENIEAMEFLKHLNAIVHNRCPGVLMCAEESSAFPQVTHSLEGGGLGFDLKWNMGWMNDTLRYFHTDPFFRHYHHNDLTFGLLYLYSEKFLLPLSHDEVVHGKRSLLSKMPGDDWQKFANLRLLLSYLICQPGKKLLFMGAELAQWGEWDAREELQWGLLRFPIHAGIHRMVRELNHFYLKSAELWELDFDYRGFRWVDFSDRVNSVISYLRHGYNSSLLCVHNFTPTCLLSYRLDLPGIQNIEEVFSTDREEYGGSGKLNEAPIILYSKGGDPIGIEFVLAPLATMIFSVKFL